MSNGGVIGKAVTSQSGIWTMEDVALNKNNLRIEYRSVELASVKAGLSTDGLRVYGTSADIEILAWLSVEFTAKQYIEILCADHDIGGTTYQAIVGIGSADGAISKGYFANTGVMYTWPGPTNAAYGSTFANGDRIGISYNPDNGKFRMWKNGTEQPEIDILSSGSRYPLLRLGTGSSVAVDITFCVDASTITYLPDGYLPFNRVGW